MKKYKLFFTTSLLVLFIITNCKNLFAQDIMLQAWWWEYPKTGQGKSFVDTLINKSKYIADRGYKYVWLPPLSLGQGGGASNGYDTYDYYHLGTNSRKTGFGTRTKVDQLIDSLSQHNILSIADVVYNHRSGGSPEFNPAVKGWIENYTFQKHENGDNSYPTDRFRNIIPIGTGTGLGAGTYYFKVKSASSHPDYFDLDYQFAIWTKKKNLSGTVNTENEPNGGGDCGQGSSMVPIGTRINASIDAFGCGVDEFQVTLSAADFFNVDTIFITMMNNGAFSDHFIYGIWYTGTNSNIQQQMIYQTYTSFQSVPSGRGQFNYMNFRPNGQPTCLCGDTDWMWFFYDVDQSSTANDSLRAWTRWLVDDVDIKGFRIDAVKHMPSWFLGDLFDHLHGQGINPKMVVGEAYDYDPVVLKSRVDDVYNFMDNSTKDSIIYRLFDFNLQAALRDACDAFGYDARNVFNAGMVDNQNMSRLNAVSFVNNHDFREDYNRVDNDPILGYAYILTNPTVGTPCVYYEDYLTDKFPGYAPKINKLISAYQRYIKDAGYREYLNRYNTPFSSFFTSGSSSNALIYQLGGTNGTCSNGNGVVAAINFSGEPMKVYQKLNMWPGYQLNIGDTLFDVTGNVASGYAIVNNNQEIYVDIPVRSYAVYVKGSTPVSTNIAAQGSTNICLGEKVKLVPNTINPCYYYQWQLNNNDIPDGDQPTYEATQSGTYRLVISLGGNLKTYSQSITVTVSPDVPVATLTNGELNTNANGSLQWYFGIFPSTQQPITGATNQNYIPTQNGYYSVVVTDANGCSARSNLVQLLAVNIEAPGQSALSVYPSPAYQTFTIEGTPMAYVFITDMWGRMVKEFEMPGSIYTVDSSSLPSGIYRLTHTDLSGNVSISKIVIIRE
jgi:alpha-amylase